MSQAGLGFDPVTGMTFLYVWLPIVSDQRVSFITTAEPAVWSADEEGLTLRTHLEATTGLRAVVCAIN
jgi:hypothetical protein